MFCKKCGIKIADDNVNFCQNCGGNIKLDENKEEQKTTVPKTASSTKNNLLKNGCLGLIILFSIFVAFLVISLNSYKVNSIPEQNAKSNSSISTKDSNPNKVENWQYSEKEDIIHNNIKIKFAKTKSINTLSFKFPYDGIQHANLIIRKNFDGSKDAMFMIERGQFLSSILGSKALIRFDDSSPEEFQLLAPTDNSTTVVFIKYADYFVKKTIESKKLYFQTDFYQEGSQTLEFTTEGLKEL